MLQTLKSTNRDVIKYLILSVAVGFSLFGIIMVAFNLYLLRMNYDTRFIGIANSCAPISFALTGILAGILGRSWGSRKTTATAFICLSLSVILIPATQFLSPENAKIAIIILRILTGSGISLFFVTSEPYMVSATTPENRVFIFSLGTGVRPAAAFFGALLAGFIPDKIAGFIGTDISSPLPFSYLLAFAGVILIPFIPIALSTKERLKIERSRTAKPQSTSVKPIAVTLLILCLSLMLRSSGESTALAFFNVFLEVVLTEPPWKIGIIMGFGQLIALPAALLSPFLTKKTGKVNATIIAILGMAIGLFIIMIAQDWLLAGLGYGLTNAALTMAIALGSVVHMETIPRKFRSISSGFFALAGGIGYGGMSFLGGFLIPNIGFTGLYLIGFSGCIVSAVIFLGYFKSRKKMS